MLVNLPNGKTIDMSFEDYMRMDAMNYSLLTAFNVGFETNDPFTGSAMRRHQVADKIDKEPLVTEESGDDEEEGYYEETPLYEPEE